MSKHKIVKSEYEEIVLVERDGLQVRAAVNAEGQVMTDYVRVMLIEDGKATERAMWSINEVNSDLLTSDVDPSTAFNAILSVIELVASGAYREVQGIPKSPEKKK